MRKFRRKLLANDDDVVMMKEPEKFLGNPNLTKCKIREVFIQTVEPFSTREDTKIVVKIGDITFTKANLDKFSNNAVHINAEKGETLIGPLNEFESLFDVSLGKWVTAPIELDIYSRSKLLDVRC